MLVIEMHFILSQRLAAPAFRGCPRLSQPTYGSLLLPQAEQRQGEKL
jgi:hypothetical protein